MKNSIGEILKKISLAKTEKQKIDILQDAKTDIPVAFGNFLRHVYDPTLKFLLPEGEFEYTPMYNADQQFGRGAFLHHLTRLYLFLEGCPTQITQQKRESLFRQMLESIDPLDAAACIAMKDKKLPYDIPRKLIEKAFPGFLPAETKV